MQEKYLILKGNIAFIQIIVHLKKNSLRDFASSHYAFFILANASQFWISAQWFTSAVLYKET